jgi:hypothetical protein
MQRPRQCAVLLEDLGEERLAGLDVVFEIGIRRSGRRRFPTSSVLDRCRVCCWMVLRSATTIGKRSSYSDDKRKEK